MKIANGRSDITRISFVRESTVSNEIADNTVPSFANSREGVTTKMSEMTKRNEVKFFFRSATQPIWLKR